MSILNIMRNMKHQGDFGNELIGKYNPVKNMVEANKGIANALDKGKKRIIKGAIKKAGDGVKPDNQLTPAEPLIK